VAGQATSAFGAVVAGQHGGPDLGEHRHSFTTMEIGKIKLLLDEVRRSDRSRQKSLRAQLRRMGFYITDYAADQMGFTSSDVDRLVSRGVIKLLGSSTPTRRTDHDLAPASQQRSADQNAALKDDELSENASQILDALASLSPERAVLLAQQKANVPARPGLYAIYGDEVWQELGLGEAPDDRPLYVGKAEDSLAARDIKTHFGNGRTGQSTVRRSFAALLAHRLGLRGMPRNPTTPGHYSNYGLSSEDDQKLTEWMERHLRLAVWSKPAGLTGSLIAVERAVLARLQPPLNLKDVDTPWAPRIRQARKALADQARAWRPGSEA
jgi:hypothetical protein